MSKNNGFDEWGGYMEAKITKLQEQYAAASNPFMKSNLFAGISIFVNGRTDPSADELKRIMMTYGGTYHHYERSQTTFIVAENLPDVKVRQMQNAKKNIIKAQWIVDCVKENRILDYSRYLLYTNQKSTQPCLNFDKSHNNTALEGLQTASYEIKDKPQATTSIASIDLKTNLEALSKKILTNTNFEQNVSVTDQNTTVKTAHTKTAKDENFISEFYNNSRLHHIATLGAGFKQYVTELRERSGIDFSTSRARLKKKLSELNAVTTTNSNLNGQYIMHIDMDCFFVSVGLRQHVHLRGQPLAVTHSRGGASATDVPVHAGANREAERELWMQRNQDNVRSGKVNQSFGNNYSLSEIASCSYEARQCGVKNGMFVGQALQLCPNLQTIPYDFEGYKQVAYQLYDTVSQYTLDIEAVSCDEMFVDLTPLLVELKALPMQVVGILRQEVRGITRCPCSAGVGPNKLLARMATKRAKPDGQFQIALSEAKSYMAPMPISDLPGVGSSTAYALKQAEIKTCADLQQVSLTRLQMLVGKKTGETLQLFSCGIDKRPLVFMQVRKSISAEVNYGIRFQEEKEVEDFLLRLSDEVHERLLEIKRRTKCVTLKLMVRAKDAPTETAKYLGHGVCDSISKAVTLNEYTNNKSTIRSSVLDIMKLQNIPPTELRGIGIQLTKLDEPATQSTNSKHSIEQLFKRAAEKQNNVSALDKTERSCINTNEKVINSKKLTLGKRGASKNECNVINMLQKAVKKKQLPAPVNIESNRNEFLEALPANLRNEILQSYSQLQQLEAEYAVKKKQQEKLDGHNAQIDNNEVQEKSVYNIFKQTDFMKAIIAWVNSSADALPSESDIKLIIEHAIELVHEEAHYLLYGQLTWLGRLLGRYRGIHACKWHTAYRQILESVQKELCASIDCIPYFIPDPISCDKCEKQ